ncbi:PREDICTED: putative F-box protein At1g20795 [Camelina sativa]|uniref:F-box protein At1g20795 n=1 Tax=Camelina sativa TaxID=90675 RepID=A0ABM1R716_CAMSA|nr:PREDICTED: putative F-box protein At1g20795 [Camelina sativa]
MQPTAIKNNSTMEALPCSLLDQILFRLDPKSLAMMQCTGRYINSYISDDIFRSEYMSRVGTGLLHISSFGSNILFCYPFGDSTLFRNQEYPLDVKTRVLSICSGLLLLLMDGLCVVNPLTKRYRFLDHSKSKFLSRADREEDETFVLGWEQLNRIGFAVDQIDRTTQRFKVVIIKEVTEDASKPDKTVYQFEISTGASCWKLSKTTITCSASELMADKKPLYLDGSLHWLRNDGSILAFNPETEQARLVPIKLPSKLITKNLFTVAGNVLALVSATDEVIYIYHLGNILIDPKWVLVKQIQNRAVDKSWTRFWYLGAYDGKSLVVRENEVIHVYDLSADEWGFVGWVPQWCDGFQNFHHFTLSLSSARELNEKVDVERVNPFLGERISSLRKIMRLIDDSNPYALAWSSKKQPIVTLSTTEAEYVAASVCACQAVWFMRMLQELGYEVTESTVIRCDNTSAIKLSKNPVFHGRCKHIGVRFHFLRELVRDGVIRLEHCGSQEQVADIFTKPLKREAFESLRSKLGICSAASKLSLMHQA